MLVEDAISLQAGLWETPGMAASSSKSAINGTEPFHVKEVEVLTAKLHLAEAALENERRLGSTERVLLEERLQFAELQDAGAKERLSVALVTLERQHTSLEAIAAKAANSDARRTEDVEALQSRIKELEVSAEAAAQAKSEEQEMEREKLELKYRALEKAQRDLALSVKTGQRRGEGLQGGQSQLPTNQQLQQMLEDLHQETSIVGPHGPSDLLRCAQEVVNESSWMEHPANANGRTAPCNGLPEATPRRSTLQCGADGTRPDLRCPRPGPTQNASPCQAPLRQIQEPTMAYSAGRAGSPNEILGSRQQSPPRQSPPRQSLGCPSCAAQAQVDQFSAPSPQLARRPQDATKLSPSQFRHQRYVHPQNSQEAPIETDSHHFDSTRALLEPSTQMCSGTWQATDPTEPAARPQNLVHEFEELDQLLQGPPRKDPSLPPHQKVANGIPADQSTAHLDPSSDLFVQMPPSPLVAATEAAPESSAYGIPAVQLPCFGHPASEDAAQCPAGPHMATPNGSNVASLLSPEAMELVLEEWFKAEKTANDPQGRMPESRLQQEFFLIARKRWLIQQELQKAMEEKELVEQQNQTLKSMLAESRLTVPSSSPLRHSLTDVPQEQTYSQLLIEEMKRLAESKDVIERELQSEKTTALAQRRELSSEANALFMAQTRERDVLAELKVSEDECKNLRRQCAQVQKDLCAETLANAGKREVRVFEGERARLLDDVAADDAELVDILDESRRKRASTPEPGWRGTAYVKTPPAHKGVRSGFRQQQIVGAAMVSERSALLEAAIKEGRRLQALNIAESLVGDTRCLADSLRDQVPQKELAFDQDLDPYVQDGGLNSDTTALSSARMTPMRTARVAWSGDTTRQTPDQRAAQGVLPARVQERIRSSQRAIAGRSAHSPTNRSVTPGRHTEWRQPWQN